MAYREEREDSVMASNKEFAIVAKTLMVASHYLRLSDEEAKICQDFSSAISGRMQGVDINAEARPRDVQHSARSSVLGSY